MTEFLFKPVLMTAEAINLETWKGTEWFGVTYPYVPYWDANEEHVAYGKHNGESLFLEIDEDFEFLVVYLHGEFVCSMELGQLLHSPSVLNLKNISFIKEHEGLKNAFCPSQ